MLRHQAWIVLVGMVVFFAGLGRPRLWDDDESKNARCAQEMLDRGDWVVPMFNFRLRPDKPALFYWLAMASYSLFGVSEFAARFPSALLAVGTALITYHLGRRLFRPEVGLWAGLVMATNWMFAVVGRFATPDSTLIFCTTAALLAYVVGVEKWTPAGAQPPIDADNSSSSAARFRDFVPRSLWSFVAMDAAMGLAVLAKGPVGVVLPVAAIGGFVLFEGSRSRQAAMRRAEVMNLGSQLPRMAKSLASRLRWLVVDFPSAAIAMRPIVFLSAFCAVAVPWYLLVAIRTHGVWLQEFFWNHNVERFLEPREGHHGLLLFPPLTLLACFFPWSIFLPAALVAAVRRIARDSLDAAACRMMFWWAAVWIVFFSICGTKQPNYIVPAYPALAVLTGRWIADWIAQASLATKLRRLPLAWATMGFAGVGLSVGIVVGKHWFPEIAGFSWVGLILIAGAIGGWLFERRRLTRLAMASVVASAALLFPALIGGVAAPLSAQQNGVRVAALAAQLPQRPSQLGQFRLAFVGLVWYADRKVEELATADDAAALFADGKSSLIATDPEGFRQLDALRPGELQIVAREPRFGRHGDMVLVARATSVAEHVAAKNKLLPAKK